MKIRAQMARSFLILDADAEDSAMAPSLFGTTLEFLDLGAGGAVVPCLSV
jgi:hypothetical protein